jgi:ribonuclease G
MAKNILVISCDIAETRVALIESGIIAELHIERRGAQPRGGTVGDIYLGKVTRVLPGLQAAFVDIGLERAAFLHVEDLIRPNDFETYLAGGRKHALGPEGSNGAVEGRAHDDDDDDDDDEPVAAAAEAGSGTAGELDEDAREEPDDESDDGGAQDAMPEDAAADIGSIDAVANGDDGPGESTTSAAPISEAETEDADGEAAYAFSEGDDADDTTGSEAEVSVALAKSPSGDVPPPLARSARASSKADVEPIDDLLDDPDLPGFTMSDPGAATPTVTSSSASAAGERNGGGRGRRRRGRERGRSGGRDGGRDVGRDGREAARREPRPDQRPRTSATAGRLSKSTPIREVVKEGQEIIVQITKEPIGTKGARCSSHVSLPGRYVVYLPTLDHVGVSKRIGNDKERARLRDAIDGMKPPTGGLIVRTVAEGLTKKQLKHDVGYLVRLWGEVAQNRQGARAPKTLCSELDIVLKTARDLFTDDVDQIVVDDKAQYDRLCRFVEMFMPDRLKDVLYFNEDDPIFDAYGIEDEIARALSRKVPLESGGYLIIDEAEALTAIDVNTGRFVGKGSKDMEETILQTNLEAVQEIAYQLRFRNIGGLIILDLIDMERPSNREKVRKTLEALLQKDKAKTTLNRISELGLIEMTRKRTRESLGRLLHEPCFYCDGTGHLQSKETIAYEILREIRRRRNDLPGYTVVVNCHPAVSDLLTGSDKSVLHEAESRYMRRIQVNSRTEYHLEQFDLVGK